MTQSKGLSHIAMSVPAGTLTDEFRTEVLDFYGAMFGWVEIESLRRPDRMTLAVGRHCYVNVRERDESMTCTGYEHIGLLVESPEAADATWQQLDSDPRTLELEPIDRGDDGYRNFRFRYLLPLAIEVQFLP
jgi:catechol 2,3-dioxygenase-like lactoylglutathione lyase family enzyme